MKKYKFLVLIIPILLFSCESYLDKAPDLGLDDADVFNNFLSVQGYLDKSYYCINDFSRWNEQGLQRAHVSQLSDEGTNPYTSTSMANTLNKGSWLGVTGAAEVGWGTTNVGNSNGQGNVIPNAFYALRIANRVIENAPLMSTLTSDQKDQLMGQAYFFRSWFYFEVIRRVGGMPLMDKIFSVDYDFDEVRLSYQESSDWAITQLDEAIKLLPDEWPADETGRPIKASAYALKSMMELYAASPLMNNPVGVVEDHGYNIEYCKKAAQYGKEALDYIDQTVPKHKMTEGMPYQNIFYHSPNFVSDESLWYINSTGQNRGGSSDLPIFWMNVEFSNQTGNYGQAHICPTQNMVDMFETSNGYPVKLIGSTWVTNDPAFVQSAPFANRDPRLAKDIIVPGEAFGTINNNINYLCTWEGGRDVAPAKKPIETNLTGYMVKKWLWPSAVNTRLAGGTAGRGDYYYNCIMIRTTQVWLDYAEAMNEAYGPTNNNGYTYSALDAINHVRDRVGMNPVRSEFTGDKEVFRERIRNERAVELMFENHRWFDIRRWMTAQAVFNPAGDSNPIKGVTVTATAVGKYKTSNAYTDKVLVGNVFKYEQKSVTTELRVFQKKHYWYPLGKDEAERFVYLKQNPGW